jgi:hypothetical protein
VENPKRIVIECNCSPCHDWMAFASWYSFRKMIPDLEVSVRVHLDGPIFRWVHRLSSISRSRSEGDLTIPPTVVAARDFLDDWSISPAKSQAQTCLVDYSGGCGNFVVDDWINTNRHPFHKATLRFGTSSMTANESAVFRLWESCESLHRAAGV